MEKFLGLYSRLKEINSEIETNGETRELIEERFLVECSLFLGDLL